VFVSGVLKTGRKDQTLLDVSRLGEGGKVLLTVSEKKGRNEIKWGKQDQRRSWSNNIKKRTVYVQYLAKRKKPSRSVEGDQSYNKGWEKGSKHIHRFEFARIVEPESKGRKKGEKGSPRSFVGMQGSLGEENHRKEEGEPPKKRKRNGKHVRGNCQQRRWTGVGPNRWWERE